MPCDHKLILSVDGLQVVNMGEDLVFNTVEALIEAHMHWASITEVVAGPGGLEIEDPVGSINAASEGYDDTVVLWWVANESVDTVTVIVDYLCVLETDSLAELARPAFDEGLGFISNGWEMSESGG